MAAFVPDPVPTLWPGETLFLLGTGATLTAADVEACRGHGRVIAINGAYTLAPWADVLYAADEHWWVRVNGAPTFAGLKWTIEPQRKAWPGLQVLANRGLNGLERDPTGLRTGLNSGYQAINLAVHFGAKRIVLLGYDLRGGHFFAPKDQKLASVFAGWLKQYPTLVEPLRELGIEIINCTPGSALTCFPMMPLADVLQELAA